MKQFSKFRTRIGNFAVDTTGNVAMITAISILPMLLLVGAAIDYSRISHTRTILYDALDAAILSAGSDMLEGSHANGVLRQRFEAMFEANVNIGTRLGTDYEITRFSVNQATGEVSAQAKARVPMYFMQLGGLEELEVPVASSAIFKQDKIEVAMMLDVTGSMRGSKINALKRAATRAIDILLPRSGSNTARIALVPYATSINAGPYASVVANGSVRVATANGTLLPINTHVNTRRCVTERGGRDAATDAPPSVARLGSDIRAVSGNNCPDLAVRPLTNQRNQLLSDINRMRATGITAGHLGVAWSYYALSENWDEVWPSRSDPVPYGTPNTRKVAILMTDGEFNTFYSGTTGSPFGYVRESSDLAMEICTDMKAPKGTAPGITVFAVAFQAPASAQQTLRNCASPDTVENTHYFSADNEAELTAAFEAIAQNIKRLRLSR